MGFDTSGQGGQGPYDPYGDAPEPDASGAGDGAPDQSGTMFDPSFLDQLRQAWQGGGSRGPTGGGGGMLRNPGYGASAMPGLRGGGGGRYGGGGGWGGGYGYNGPGGQQQFYGGERSPVRPGGPVQPGREGEGDMGNGHQAQPRGQGQQTGWTPTGEPIYAPSPSGGAEVSATAPGQIKPTQQGWTPYGRPRMQRRPRFYGNSGAIQGPPQGQWTQRDMMNNARGGAV